MTVEMTPMMEQYMRFKEEHTDAILLFRMGDFYETFYEDAQEASRLLGLTLTARNNGRSKEKIPLAGLPYHALDTYLARLIRAGKKVAICEQMEPPQKGKKIVRREVVQVVSPGTTLSENLLDQKQNNYMVGLYVDGTNAGLAVIDLSTGDFQVLEREVKELWEIIEVIGPAEILAPKSWVDSNSSVCKSRFSRVLLTHQEDWYFGYTYAYEALVDHFKISSLKGFGCEKLTVGVCAAGGLLCYLQKNQKNTLSHITRLVREQASNNMTLDLVTQRNLELVSTMQEGQREGSLLSVLDMTCTALGARALRSWLSKPLVDISRIESRLDAVEEFCKKIILRKEIRTALRLVGDLERLMSKVCCGRANPRDLVGLKVSLQAVGPLHKALLQARTSLLIWARDKGVPDLKKLIDLIDKTVLEDPPTQLGEGGIIKPGINAELDDLRDVASGGRSWVAGLQRMERKKTGVGSLKVGYNKAFGYYIEVTKANQDRVPRNYIRKQTLVNAERFITPELKEWEGKIIGADEHAKEMERELFNRLRDEVADWVEPVQRTAQTIALVDVLSSLAEIAVANDYVRPFVDESTRIQIQGGRHPVVEHLLPSGKFVPNDIKLECNKDQVLIITGPNMAGKSTILRQVGLIVLMSQVGSFVPARLAHIGLVDRIFTRVGASDNMSRGESTFLVEMNEAANILNNATPKSLVLLDEIGRGTSTFDGLSIAWAMTEYLHNSECIRPRTLFATHYHELTELEDLLDRVLNYSVAVKEAGEKIVFLHRLVRGGCNHSYGIEVAQLAGMPSELIVRAKEILSRLEQNDLSITQPREKSEKLGQENGQTNLFPLLISEKNGVRHPILDELLSLDISQFTPLEALVKLDDWKKRVESEGISGTEQQA